MAKKRKKPNQLATVAFAERAIKRQDSDVENLAAKFVRAEAMLTTLVARAVLSGKLGQKKNRERFKREAKTIIESLKKVGIKEGKKVVEQAYRSGVQIASTQGHSRMNKQAIDILQENLTGRLEDSTTVVGRRVDDIFRREGLRLAAAQVGDEKPLEEVTVQMRKILEKEGVTAFVDKSGKKWGLESYAKMAIATATAEATNHGVQTTLLARGFDVVKVDHPGGFDNDELCAPYHGKLFSLSGKSKKYPRLKKLPPFHPNCKHYIRPVPETLSEREERQGAAA